MEAKTLAFFIMSYIAVMTVLLITMMHFKASERQPISYMTNHTMGKPVSILHDQKNIAQLTSINKTAGYSMEMTIRMAAIPRLLQFLYCKVLRSAALFWSPKLGNVTLILDEESKADHEFAARLQKQQHSLGFDIRILYEPLPKDRTILETKGFSIGYNRQLWSSFFMDLYIDADIIAWMDVDATFSTPVTPENIFKGNKLRVKGKSMMKNSHYYWDTSTRVAIGKKLMAHFMIYFPTFIWRDTFTNCRNYIIKHLNVSSFEDAFRMFHDPPRLNTSPVTLILAYAYYFEHDRYDWHLDVNKRIVDSLRLPAADLTPEVHVTGHEKFYEYKGRHTPLKQGYCIAKRVVDKLPIGCETFKDTVNFQLFEFEHIRYHHLDTWCKGPTGRNNCAAIIEKHYQNVRKSYQKGLYNLDIQKVQNVEKAAAKANITCPHVFDFP